MRKEISAISEGFTGDNLDNVGVTKKGNSYVVTAEFADKKSAMDFYDEVKKLIKDSDKHGTVSVDIEAKEFFKSVAKKGMNITLTEDVYWGALDIPLDKAKKIGFKVGNDYGDNTGEYIVPKGSVLTIDYIGKSGSYGTFIFKGIKLDAEDTYSLCFKY